VTAPVLSVVVCSYNGAARIGRTLDALAAQTIAERLEIVVVDDGSRTPIPARPGVRLVRHDLNRGLAAARNTGVAHATADRIAFTDDDCVPDPDWAERLLAAFAPGVAAVGGPVRPSATTSWLLRYLGRNNPLEPLELNLARGGGLLYRLALYAARQWTGPRPGDERRDVYSLVGANMAFTGEALAGGFDEAFRFGAEELDLFMRLPGVKRYEPTAVVRHVYVDSLRDSLRRSRSYGVGAARLYRKWPAMRPTVYPGPFAVALCLGLALWSPWFLLAAALLPLALHPVAVRRFLRSGRPEILLDPYATVAFEASGNAGFLKGLRA
jgi:glycosyltransferase involved in cell wall biosynthesis